MGILNLSLTLVHAEDLLLQYFVINHTEMCKLHNPSNMGNPSFHLDTVKLLHDILLWVKTNYRKPGSFGGLLFHTKKLLCNFVSFFIHGLILFCSH